MERLIIRGTAEKFLTLPSLKQFRRDDGSSGVHAADEETFPELFISKAVKRKKFRIDHIDPSVTVGKEHLKIPQTLKELLLQHPFPRSQGPLRMPIKCENLTRVFRDKTLFSHSESQLRSAWVPLVKGSNGWSGNQGQVTYKVTDLSTSIQGAASTRNKSMLYTCTRLGCTIECPCNICTDTENLQCKRGHRSGLCSNCNTQCGRHEIKVPHLFDATTDMYTIITDELDMDKYLFAFGYAGIPRSCSHCSEDVMQHQIYHLVYHPLCRFCSFEFRPFEFLLVNKSGRCTFKKTVIFINMRDLKTCSTCLLECKDKKARERHEAIVHHNAIQKFKCDLCPSSYSNKNAMGYHFEQKHQQPVQRHPCDVCDLHFSTLSTLKTHKSIKHRSIDQVESEEESKEECEDCGKKFLLLSSLNRHQREQHFDVKFNIDFYEGLDPPKSFECEQCGHKFKRMEHLRRHVQRKHSGTTTFKCSQCGKIFGRQDALSLHMKSDHVVEEYNCDECEQTFKRKDVLSRHVESVHCEKTFKCDECEKEYARKDDLGRHVKSVHRLKSFMCVVCDQTFSRKDSLLRHVKSKH